MAVGVYERKLNIKYGMTGKKHSEESKEKMRKSHTGVKLSEEHKESVKNSNVKYWLGRYHTEKTKNKISKSQKGKEPWNKNKKGVQVFSKETRRKMSESHKGEKSYLWKGGLSFLLYPVDWTETLKRAIRERDNYICQICSQYGNYVHHINYDKKNCNPKNLITLCLKCHTKTNHNREYWIKYFNNK